MMSKILTSCLKLSDVAVQGETQMGKDTDVVGTASVLITVLISVPKPTAVISFSNKTR